MTNTLHRLGDPERRSNDFVIVCTTAVGINSEGSAAAKREFLRIAVRHGPVNLGTGDETMFSLEEIGDMSGLITDDTGLTVVFDDRTKLQRVIEEIAHADLGLCFNISGVDYLVDECCRAAGLVRHSVENSLGMVGDTDLLPSRPILEISSLCGHGMVSANLIGRVLHLLKTEQVDLDRATALLCRPCVCGAVNPTRVRELLGRLTQANS